MDILADLRANICEVTFTKANGDERTMICTLIPDFLPKPDPTLVLGSIYADSIQSNMIDNIVVWDIEENAWRSFKPSRVTDIKFSKE